MKPFFWFLAGGHTVVLSHTTLAQDKYFRAGLIIFLTGVFSGISAGYAVYGTFDGNLIPCLVAGFLWAMFIITLDSIIVSSIEEVDTLADKLKMAIPRLILAACIGIVIARPLELKLFEHEIKDRLIDIEMAKCQQRGEPQKTDYLEKRQNWETRIKTKKKEVNAKRRECEKLQDVAFTPHRVCLDAIPKLEKEQADLEQSLSELDKEQHRNYGQDCNKDSITKRMQNHIPSFLEANSTLHTLSNGAGSESVKWVILFITLLFVLLETTPVFIKVFQESDADYKNNILQFRADLKALSYLNLLEKYPFLPAQKWYLRNYKNNILIYEKLSKEYSKMEDTKRFLKTGLELSEHRNKIEVENKKALDVLVASGIKAAHADVAADLVKRWKQATLADIAQNPEKYVDLPRLDKKVYETQDSNQPTGRDTAQKPKFEPTLKEQSAENEAHSTPVFGESTREEPVPW